MTPETAINCTEAAGKTVSRLQLFQSEGAMQELLLEFTDGTAFSVTVEAKTVRTAYLFRQSEGEPQTIRRYGE